MVWVFRKLIHLQNFIKCCHCFSSYLTKR